jgi:hypothetical protein
MLFVEDDGGQGYSFGHEVGSYYGAKEIPEEEAFDKAAEQLHPSFLCEVFKKGFHDGHDESSRAAIRKKARTAYTDWAGDGRTKFSRLKKKHQTLRRSREDAISARDERALETINKELREVGVLIRDVRQKKIEEIADEFGLDLSIIGTSSLF